MASIIEKVRSLGRSTGGDLQVDYGNINPTEKVGAPGTAIYGGLIQRNEKNQKLSGTRRYVTFSDTLVNVAIVGAGVRYFLNLIARAEWTAQPVDDSPKAKEMADLVTEVLDDMETPWRRVVRRAAMYKFYGFSIQEWTAKMREDGVIGFLDVEPRPQQTIDKWDRDENGRIVGVVQVDPQTYREIPIPRTKLVYVVDDTLDDSPEGLGLFRHLVPVTDRLRAYENLEGYGFETDLRGIPVGRAPKALLQKLVNENKMTKAQMDDALQVMQDFVENHIRQPETGLLLDSLTYQTTDDKGTPSQVKQWDLELLKGSSTGMKEVGEAIRRLTHEAARILGVEGLLLGEGPSGSRALSEDKSHNFFLIVESCLAELKESFQKDLLGPMWKLNGFDPDLMPDLMPSAVKFHEISEITQALNDLASAGAPLAIDDPVVNEIRDLLGLPRIEDMDEEEVDAMVNKPDEPEPGDMPQPEEPDENNELEDEEVPDGSGSGNE